MAHFCGFIKLIFLLLMLARIPFNESRPLRGKSQTTSDLIAGNEFLKLFMEHDQLDKDYYNSEYAGGGGGGGVTARNGGTTEEQFDKKSAETGRRSSSGRSLKDKGPKQNQAEGQFEDSKQVVKLVTSGSKIVFLEDYDENDAILDAEARDIDLKRETFKKHKTQQRDINKTNLDDFKVVAVSVSSSSQRGTTTARQRLATTLPTTTTTTTTTMTTTTKSKFVKYDKSYTTSKPMIVTMTPKPPTATTTVKPTPPTAQQSSTRTDSLAADNFINRSHKSEFSIEEVEPLTMTQQHKSRKLHSRHRAFPITSVADTLEALDSENSASTNIHNVLAAPLQPAASARSTSTVTSTYHSSQRNVSINHDSNLHASKAHKTVDDNAKVIEMPSTSAQEQSQATIAGIEDQLLPFQTVIYHDTKAGHGPQSRSISYSSLSQNVEDLKKWQQSGILAEARRNVSESLKPLARPTQIPDNHQPEVAKFYSQPSKMYSEPSKFYSEPSKVYSEPSKVYGEPEKFYSEPAKVYGQPSKFYSEPSKVYSQPSKVYSEPAKTYWPLLTTLTTTSTSSPYITTTLTPPTNSPQITTILPPPSNNAYQQTSRKSAIVSRIAFGEAQSTTTTTTTTEKPSMTTTKSYGSHIQHHHSRTYGHRHQPSTFSSSSASSSPTSNNENSSSSSSTPSRRILFNLDRLPYDLLNAPEPSSTQQQLLELQKSKRPPPQQTLTYQQHQQQQQQQQRHHINPCLESAVTSLFSSSTLSAHPALQKQRQQQHSSLSDQQHSNQNAKGLPNGDLVKCVAEISHTSSAAEPAVSNDDDDTGEVEAFTTERSHIEELFSPTPEQNYEIEESVSVMTNGRAHGGDVHSGGGRNSLAQPTTSPIHQQQHHGFKPNRQRTRIHFGTNVNNPVEVVNGVSTSGVHGGHHLSQSYNTNANANVETNSNNRNPNDGNASPDYNNNYDDGNNDGTAADDDGSPKNTDYDDDNDNNDDDDGGGGSNKNPYRHNDANNSRGGSANNNNNNGDDDDSKVAYVVEGRNYRKYRVEEKTDDGFIVGEYGVVDHNDGNLRGVRYTADSTINRSLIQKALLTFLKLK